MAKKFIKFGVSDAKGLRASTWKLWTETSGGKSEIYFSNRSLGGELKTSLHESGKWHNSFSYNTYKEKVEGKISTLKDRFVEKWDRPPEISDGVTLAFRIVTPSSSITNSTLSGKYKKVIWLPNAPESKATEIDIIITKPSVQILGWPGKHSMGTSLIGSFQLNNGDTAWVIYCVINMPDLSKLPNGTGNYFKGKSKKDIKSDGMRLLLFGSEPDGSRVIYDFGIQNNTIK